MSDKMTDREKMLIYEQVLVNISKMYSHDWDQMKSASIQALNFVKDKEKGNGDV